MHFDRSPLPVLYPKTSEFYGFITLEVSGVEQINPGWIFAALGVVVTAAALIAGRAS